MLPNPEKLISRARRSGRSRTQALTPRVIDAVVVFEGGVVFTTRFLAAKTSEGESRNKIKKITRKFLFIKLILHDILLSCQKS